MSRTVFTNGNTAVSCANLYIQMRICNRVAKLFVSASCCEHCKCADKRYLSGRRKTCTDTYHITLCDTTVDVTIRKFFLKHSCLSSCSKVSIQNNKIIVFFSEFYQSASVAGSCSDFLYF